MRCSLGGTRWLRLAAVIPMLAIAQLAVASEFSARFAITGARATAAGTLYCKGRKLRTETRQGKARSIQIVDAVERVQWTLDPGQKTYRAMPVPAAMLDEIWGRPKVGRGPLGTTTRVRTEMVQGYVCDVYMTEGEGFRRKAWFSRKLDYPLKLETTISMGSASGTERTEYTSIKERKLPDSLFAPPKDYRRVGPPTFQVGATAAHRPRMRAPAPRAPQRSRGTGR